MKRGTPRHPKVDELALRLDSPRYVAVGLLEMLWHFTAEFCHAGDVGRFSDDAIAKALCWDGASTVLVSCLVDAGWLDRCACHRLRVHDWPDHADQTVQRVLHKRNQRFLQCYDETSIGLAKTSQPSPSPSPTPTPTPTSAPIVLVAAPAPKQRPKCWSPDSRAILHVLNETAGRHFREVDDSLAFIEARLSEDGVTVDGVKTMILRQWQKWKGTDMEDYMRPETLFNKTKFASYYASKDLPIHANHSRTIESNPRNSGCAPNKTDYAELARQLAPKRPLPGLVEQVDRAGHPALGNAATPPV